MLALLEVAVVVVVLLPALRRLDRRRVLDVDTDADGVDTLGVEVIVEVDLGLEVNLEEDLVTPLGRASLVGVTRAERPNRDMADRDDVNFGVDVNGVVDMDLDVDVTFLEEDKEVRFTLEVFNVVVVVLGDDKGLGDVGDDEREACLRCKRAWVADEKDFRVFVLVAIEFVLNGAVEIADGVEARRVRVVGVDVDVDVDVIVVVDLGVNVDLKVEMEDLGVVDTDLGVVDTVLALDLDKDDDFNNLDFGSKGADMRLDLDTEEDAFVVVVVTDKGWVDEGKDFRIVDDLVVVDLAMVFFGDVDEWIDDWVG